MQNINASSIEKKRIRNAYIITLALMIATLPTSALFAYYGYTNNLPQLYIPAALLLATPFFDLLPLTLLGRGKINLAMVLVITAFLLNVSIVPFIVQGLGLVIGISIVLVVLSGVGLAMSPGYSTPGLIVAVVFGALAFIFDGLLGTERIRVPELESYTPYIVVVIALPILFIFIREFNRFSLQVKITLGILLTGGFTVATLILFGLNRANSIGNFLANRYERSVTTQTETNISNAIQNEANNIEALFLKIQDDLIDIANYRSGLEKRKIITTQGEYWNASEELMRLPGGQYGNASTNSASVFIPNTYSLSDEILTDLNTTIYLDFLIPGMLDSQPEVTAIYYISKLGYTVYYPNIRLAENVPPDFDPTTQSFYTIAAPQNNPERLPRWTNPYQDPAGAGLIITLSIPVYDGNVFEGVVSADIKLFQINQTVSNIRLSDTGIPVLVDKGGLIIAMTESGYRYFELEPEALQENETPTLSVLNSPLPDARELALQIFGTDSGISKFMVDDVETYLSVATLESTGYKLAFIAPVNELNREIVTSRAEVEQEIAETFQDISIILTLLFGGALIASLGVGQIITRPLKRLTETVEQIAAGNLSSRASVETGDESGLLARSFNSMADRLTETLQGLEDRIAERTSELEALSQNSIRRATLFESIARISRIISSTRSIDRLLPQITETISSQLGYYHVGIFLVDVHREYAVLVAANSEGGQVMLARNHRLRVGETGLVGYVTQSGSPRTALDVGQDAIYFNNPDLPETHSEIALPLRSGSEIIGALDVQSKLTNAFTDEDVNILSTLADQVSIAIQNARSFQQSLEALEQAQRAAAQLSEQQWSQFLRHQPNVGFHFDGINTKNEAPGQKSLTNSIAIPITLRGVQIGTLKLSTPDSTRKWDESEIAMATATAERTALAIETARLLKDAQKRAAKERAIGQISAKIGNLVNIDNIVQTAIQELGETMPGTDVAIQFTSGNIGQKT
jgi:GAF domain-containing protein/HAMP domain-containing protein